MSLGERIKKLRGDESREDFGRKFGKNRNTILRYENNTNPPDAAFIEHICCEYKVSADWLIYGIDSRLKEGPIKETAFCISDDNLAVIVSRWQDLPEEDRQRITNQVKEKTAPFFLYAAKAARWPEHSQQRAEYIWSRGCKDAGLPGMFDTESFRMIEQYTKGRLDDPELYRLAKEWAATKLQLIRKLEKKNGNHD